jgi:dienelactone hydrolase
VTFPLVARRVVVIHDALGITTDLRWQADGLAGAGYLVLAPDLYYWGPRMRCLFATIRAAARRQGRTFDDLEAAAAGLPTAGTAPAGSASSGSAWAVASRCS